MSEELEQSVDQIEDAPAAEEYAPGELAPCIVTQARVWKPDDLKREGLLDPLKSLIASLPGVDDLARRFAVLETWEARLFDRGHQHNVADGEGFKVASAPDSNRRNSIAEMSDAGINNVNIYSAQGDICTGVLNRGKVKVQFSPRRSKRPQDVAASEAANSYTFLWEKNNPAIQKDITNCAWTDCRSLVWTRTIADKRFGLDDEGKPRQMEVSSTFGVLESKLPMLVDKVEDAGYAQIFEEADYAIQRAAYPWTEKRIKPGMSSAVDQDFERIARISTRTGIGGRMVGDGNPSREATMCYTWLRPGMYFSDNVREESKEAFLKNFPDGVFVVASGTEICAAWEESMDAHLSGGLFTRGNGQNRRALGSSDIPIAKRVNTWAELFDDFIRGSIPLTLLESQAFDAEAVASLEATPRRFLPVALDTAAGQTMQSVVGQTPQATPVPGATDLFQAYIGPIIQSIDGATPALFGGAEGSDNTVGATSIRLNQSLERFGPPWMVVNSIISKACWQAAKCCADNADSEIEETVDGNDVCVNPQALRGGEFNCIAETAGYIPEGSAMRQAKVLQILDMAAQNQQIASIVATPSNAREIVNALALDDVITVDVADAEDGALEAIELLLESEPLANPAYVDLENQIKEAEATHTQAKNAVVQSGAVPHPDNIAKGQQLEASIQTLQQQLQSTPQYMPSVPVSTDGSEDYATCAATAFSWMQQPYGRGLRRKADREQPGGQNWNKWTNVYLWWSAMKDQADKQAKAQPQAPKVSLTGKVSPSTVAQLLQSAGVQIDPQAEQQPEVSQTIREYGPASETETKVRQNGATK
jgi:hypothetical protein